MFIRKDAIMEDHIINAHCILNCTLSENTWGKFLGHYWNTLME